jgi:hypothetical protein
MIPGSFGSNASIRPSASAHPAGTSNSYSSPSMLGYRSQRKVILPCRTCSRRIIAVSLGVHVYPPGEHGADDQRDSG